MHLGEFLLSPYKCTYSLAHFLFQNFELNKNLSSGILLLRGLEGACSNLGHETLPAGPRL